MDKTHRNAGLLKAALSMAVVLAACSTRPPASDPARLPLTSVASLDVARYAGGWYEIAKYPNWFQRACVSDTKAEYRPGAGGQVVVVNRCRSKSGSTEEAIGTARPSSSGKSSELQVTFVPDWLKFLPFLWADYWVIDIDAGYQLVAVSEPRRQYLWILSRTPHVDDKVLVALLGRLKDKGFDVDKLELTPQSH
jgi:apolipoprotein D and lipocalin family protein